MALSVSCMVGSLRPALIAANRGASHKPNALACLAGILVETTDASLRLTGTDLSLRIATLAPCLVRADGAIIIPAAPFMAFVKRADATSRLDIVTDDENGVTLSCGGASVTLRGIAADEYPTLVHPEKPIGTVELSAGDLGRALRSVAFSAGDPGWRSRPILCGVYVAPRGQSVTFTAFDNYRGAEYVVESIYRGTGNLADIPIVIPIDTVDAWMRVAPKASADPVTLTVYTPAMARLEIDGLTLDTQCVDGSYPSYSQVFPLSFAGECQVSRDALTAAMKGKHTVKIARCTFTPDSLTITTGSEYDGLSTIAIPAVYDGPETMAAFDPTYLAALADAPGDNLVLHVNANPLSPLTVTTPSAPQWRAVLMPVRVSV
jgi:DNA polymerase III sliding clamp (beta) subunit (PCNA family)